MVKEYPYYDAPKILDLKHLIDYAAENYGDNPAFTFERDGEDITVGYIQMKNDIYALGTYFYSLGLRGEKIAVIGENSYEWIITYFAAVDSSNVIVPIDKELGNSEIANLIKSCDAKAFVYAESKKALIEAAKADMPSVEHYIPMAEFGEIIAKGNEMIENGNDEFEKNEIDPEALCTLIYTSGTTGTPKGVMLSQKNLTVDMVNSCRNFLEPAGTVVVLPLHHTFGFMAGVLCQIHRGYKVYINNNLKNVLKDIQKAKPHHICVVPLFVETFYKSLWRTVKKQKKEKLLKALIKVSNGLRKVGIDLRKPLFQSVKNGFGGNLEMIIAGGAPLDLKYAKGFEDIGIQIMNGYGITECSPIVSTDRNKKYLFGSAGVPIPGVEVKIHEPNEDGEGEILVKGDIVMMGYYNDPKTTADAFMDGWFKTGDVGRIDENGFIIITGRKKNIIILSNGKNVYPEEIEAVILNNVEGVNEVVVFGEDDVICAEIYTETPDEKDRIKKDVQALNDTLPPMKHIRRVMFRDTEFEKTTTKKIKRFKR